MSEWRTDVDGLGFPEGPVAIGDGRIAFVDLLHQDISIHDPVTGTTQLARVDGSPNGMRLGPDGELWFANNGGLAIDHDHQRVFAQPQVSGRIQRVNIESGRVSNVITELADGDLARPNDLIFAPDGGVVFSDPSNWEDIADPEKYRVGALYSGFPGGTAARVREVPGFVNGLVFHPQDGSLIVAASNDYLLMRFAWEGTGVQLGEPEVFCDLREVGAAPDGIVFHDGLFYVAGAYGHNVAVVDLEGRLVTTLSTGEGTGPTNLCVAYGRLWVCLGYVGKLISRPLSVT